MARTQRPHGGSRSDDRQVGSVTAGVVHGSRNLCAVVLPVRIRLPTRDDAVPAQERRRCHEERRPRPAGQNLQPPVVLGARLGPALQPMEGVRLVQSKCARLPMRGAERALA
jgi:hypothetical protein